MRSKKIKIYLLSTIFVSLSCSNKFLSKESDPTIFVSSYSMEGTDSLILFRNGYFVYNDGEVFSEGLWVKLNNKMLVLNSNDNISMNKYYQQEKIDTFKIQENIDSGFIYFNKFIYSKFVGDTCFIINKSILQIEDSKYYKIPLLAD